MAALSGTLAAVGGEGKAGAPVSRLARLDPWIKVLVPLVLLGLGLMAARYGSVAEYGRQLGGLDLPPWLAVAGAGYALAIWLFQIMRTGLWAAYRPYAVPEGTLPTLTVIIPAFNEGAMVGQAIDSVATAHYPRERLEIICIDDGSTDATWEHICQAQQRHPKLVRTIRFPANRGKKEALYAGFIAGQGEVLVTIDSDSIVAPEALQQVVAPLMAEPRMGAVAGNVKVYNKHHSFMGKMQGVRFVNLDYLRASQSVYRTVVCTPGSLSAYRRQALAPHLEAWRDQRFLGAPCIVGEDRSLTNFILRSGYYTYYQRTAVVYTLVPETYRGVCGMYLRWERGNVRESLVMLGFLFRRYRDNHRLLPIVEFALTQLEYPLTVLFLGLLALTAAVYPAILWKFLFLLGAGSLLNLLYYLWLERDLDLVYGIIYSYYAFFLLAWIYPYAVLTVREGRWLTR